MRNYVRFPDFIECEDGYCILDETYVLLPMRVKWTNKKARICKYRDGENRRKRLYLDAFLIRKVKIDISFAEFFRQTFVILLINVYFCSVVN